MTQINIFSNPLMYNSVKSPQDKSCQKNIEIIRKNLAFQQNRCYKILDLGSGSGSFLEFQDIFHNFKYIGIDSSKEMIDFCKKKYCNNKTSWRHLDMRQFKANEKFDIITSNFAIQWLPKQDMYKLFSMMYNILEKEGIFVFSLPTKKTFCDFFDFIKQNNIHIPGFIDFEAQDNIEHQLQKINIDCHTYEENINLGEMSPKQFLTYLKTMGSKSVHDINKNITGIKSLIQHEHKIKFNINYNVSTFFIKKTT